MSKYVIFHHNDLDGRCSGAIIKKYLLKSYGENIESKIFTFEVDYDENKQKEAIEESALDSETIIYVVDFSFNVDLMEYLYSLAGQNFIWIDHHITAIQKMKDKQDIIVGVRHTEYSATMLCWIYCFGREFTPTAVKYIDAFDCWKNQDKATWENVIMPFKYGLESQVTELDDIDNVWKDILQENEDNVDKLENIILRGTIIKQYMDQQNKENAEQKAYVIMFEDKRALTINDYGKGSLSLDSIYNEDEHDLMLTYSITGDGKINVGLYTQKPDVHVGNIAKKYGGGGHPGAAGFQTSVNNIQMFLKSL